MNSVLKNLLLSVPYNTSVRSDCPFCNGKNSFSISNIGSVVKYHCFRNNCQNSYGVLSVVPEKEDMAYRINKRHFIEAFEDFRLPTYLKPPFTSVWAYNEVLGTNGLKAYTDGLYKIKYDPIQERLVYLLIEEDKIVGAIGRTLIKQSPKTLLYKDSKIMPFIVGKSNTGVIVEDCASACAIASLPEYTGIALLGTRLKDAYMPYLKRFTELIIALDPDARRKQLDLKEKLGYICNKVSVWLIPKDLKNMNKEELKQCVDL